MDLSQPQMNPAVPPLSGVPYPMTQRDPLECARNLAAINALQFQMMPPAAVNPIWPQQTPFFPPNTPPLFNGQLHSVDEARKCRRGVRVGFAPWIPPLPSPFLMGITCDGIPVKPKKKAKRPSVCKEKKFEKKDNLQKSYQAKSSYENGGPSALPELTLLENSSSVQSADTYLLDSVDDDPLLCLDDLDLFTSGDFEAFLNELSNECWPEKRSVKFVHSDVEIPQKKRTKRGGISKKRPSPKRLRSLRRIVQL